MSLPPGPRSPAAIQTVHWIWRHLAYLRSCRERFGPRFTLSFSGGRRYVFVTRPDDVKAVFQLQSDQCGTGLEKMEPFLGMHSLMLLEGDRHKRHRRLIGPPLRGARLQNYLAVIDELAEEEVARWPVGEPFPVAESMRALTLQLIFRAVFGVTDKERLAELRGLVNALMQGPYALLAFLPWLHQDLGPYSPWGRFLRLRGRFTELLHEEVRHARPRAEGREDILARLTREGVEEGDPLDDQEIVDELLTLLAAGHETTTAALSWAFQWILADTTVRDRVTGEAHEGARPDGLHHDSLQGLSYLDAVLNETMRISPIFTIVPRRLLVEVNELEGLTLPAGTYLTACTYLTQREPDLYPEPDRFRPERFLEAKPSYSEFYPFGGGFRRCIGASFAMYQMRAILAAVFSRVELRLEDPTPQAARRQGITMTPGKGTPVVVERHL